ncbi:phosphatidylglycerol / phosphatidylinositol transfer protein [Cordyceps fumosorosea ARSEF 2679]|uniref:Phosphatidylglycerol/phosphatidylinositol transfer protein n=1 Tax=Cordyceps fumosorosea (strain ARSEF 2679) TaxID=1081104 RepID=A0A167V969_CORFA|nr:phosphatidylglycerol / phosphatidylinositol transfer protein [Cordyceps fumosorosea ARSEF 2679]OAA62365.1 phosphatidylglycerol / phosphatidylinositol transfer protein [Cordyceps fumosorosea ARSEF 2679]
MKFSTALGLLSVCLAPATALSILDDDNKIPGKSPLEFCSGDRSADLITIESVDLDPNPPKAGQELLIKASGTVKETIEQGAYVKLTVKYGLIKLLTQTADLCEQVGNVDLKCPIEKGEQTIEKTVKLPVEIPPGKYTVLADVYNADDTPITCLTATVTFALGGLGFLNSEL